MFHTFDFHFVTFYISTVWLELLWIFLKRLYLLYKSQQTIKKQAVKLEIDHESSKYLIC